MKLANADVVHYLVIFVLACGVGTAYLKRDEVFKERDISREHPLVDIDSQIAPIEDARRIAESRNRERELELREVKLLLEESENIRRLSLLNEQLQIEQDRLRKLDQRAAINARERQELEEQISRLRRE